MARHFFMTMCNESLELSRLGELYHFKLNYFIEHMQIYASVAGKGLK